jgi:hypothetical protein
MATREARSAQSYENEQLLLAMLPQLLSAHGFSAVSTSRHGQMKFVDARAVDGTPVKFWLKQGWTNARTCAAIQFGMFEPMPDGRPYDRLDSVFLQHVDARVASAKAQGAQYLLMVHMPHGVIRSNYVALEIDDAAVAFRRQLVGWPKRARNSNSPTLYFDDERALTDAECVSVVKELAVTLSAISGLTPAVKGTTEDSKSIWAEVERRMKQQAFRFKVGERCGWTCVVSGNQVREALDAAHLPGKNWRTDNEADDGILLRVDLHRLLDCGLAELREGRFWIRDAARCEQYTQFHDRPIALA